MPQIAMASRYEPSNPLVGPAIGDISAMQLSPLGTRTGREQIFDVETWWAGNFQGIMRLIYINKLSSQHREPVFVLDILEFSLVKLVGAHCAQTLSRLGSRARRYYPFRAVCPTVNPSSSSVRRDLHCPSILFSGGSYGNN